VTRLRFFSALLVAAPALAAAQQLAPLPAALPRTHTPQPTTPAITAADLMTRLYIFADDSMEGRAVGRLGNAKGTAYIAAEVRRMGLQPAGDSGTFFQNLPDFLPVVTEDASMRVGNTTLAFPNDFLPVGTHSLKNKALAVVYGGPLGAPMTLTPAQTAGKLVVFSGPAPFVNDSFKMREQLPQVPGAAAIAVVTLDSVTTAHRATIRYRSLHMRPQPDGPVVLLSTAGAKQLFGKELDGLPVGTAGKPVAIAYTFVSSARNVVAILPGSDPVLRHEYVAIGAHNDHLGRRLAAAGDHDSLRVFTHFASTGGAETGGQDATATPEEMDSIKANLAVLRRLHPPRPDSIYNGADDDGSGSVSVLEIAEHLAAMPVKPKRSILFVWHTGEEAGLLGSTYFTEHPTIPRDSIVGQLNIDMIGRGDASDIAGGGPNYIQVIGSRRLSTELGDLVDRVNKEGHHDFVFDYVTGEQYYTRSDHYMYARFGIPIAFFFTGVHPDYHQVTDEPEYIDYPKMARIASLISDIAVHVADLDHRLIVDHAKDAAPSN
jgi:hypothetical protein